MVTREKTDVIKKVRTYKNFITVTNMDMSRKTVRRELGKKNEGTERTKIKRINKIISK